MKHLEATIKFNLQFHREIIYNNFLAIYLNLEKSIHMARHLKDPAQFMNLFMRLCISYPDLFSMSSVKIMKINIFEDILSDGTWKESKSMLRLVLRMYATTPAYLEARIVGAPRHDLQGKVVSHVTAEENKRRASGTKDTLEGKSKT